MSILSAMIARLSRPSIPCSTTATRKTRTSNMIRVLAKAKTIAAYSYKKIHRRAVRLPEAGPELRPANFLRMMFATPAEPYEVP
jgi:citrate synthase